MSVDFSQLFTFHSLVSLFTLSILEIVLGIDNIIFISLTVNRLPKTRRNQARTIGLLLALLVRIALLCGIGWIAGLREPLLHIGIYGVSGKAIILLAGGIFLLIKTWKELKDKIYRPGEPGEPGRKNVATFEAVIIQIILIDFVFSFDSILTAVGLSGIIPIMIGAVIIAMVLMILFSGKVADFINKNPGIKMIAMVFLLVVGGLLVAESIVDCYNSVLPEKSKLHINKNYAYLALAFALLVEIFNIRERRLRRNYHPKEK